MSAVHLVVTMVGMSVVPSVEKRVETKVEYWAVSSAD